MGFLGGFFGWVFWVGFLMPTLPDVDPLLGAELVRDVGEVAADQREGDDEAVLGGELQTHLEVVLEDLAVEAEEGEVRGLHDHLVQVVHHLCVEAARYKKNYKFKMVYHSKFSMIK